MKIIVICLILFITTHLFGEPLHTLNGNVKEMANKKIELLDFYGEKNRVINSIIADSNGFFQFPFTKESYVGMYRVRFGKGKFVDMIYNQEDIEFTLNPPDSQAAGFYSVTDNIIISVSKENKLYYDFLQVIEHNQKRLALLNQLKPLYQPEEKAVTHNGQINDSIKSRNNVKVAENVNTFNDQIDNELKNLKKRQKGYIKKLTNNNSDTYVAKIVKTMQNPQPKIELSKDEEGKFVKDHFFDNVDFDDITLLNSNVIPSKIWTYFGFYRDKELSKEQQEEAFIKALDVIMVEAEVNETVFAFVLDIITRKFEKSGYELAFTYITENYVFGDLCKNDDFGLDNSVFSDRASELKDKVEKIKGLAIGKIAPEIILSALTGNHQKLTDIDAEYTLILFWASWCQHCTVTMPALKDLYDGYKDKGFEVLAISIDEDRAAWMNAITQGKYNWTNYTELKGWDSKPAIDYNVWTTPKMYLLNKEKRIVGKPSTIEEVEVFITPLL